VGIPIDSRDVSHDTSEVSTVGLRGARALPQVRCGTVGHTVTWIGSGTGAEPSRSTNRARSTHCTSRSAAAAPRACLTAPAPGDTRRACELLGGRLDGDADQRAAAPAANGSDWRRGVEDAHAGMQEIRNGAMTCDARSSAVAQPSYERSSMTDMKNGYEALL